MKNTRRSPKVDSEAAIDPSSGRAASSPRYFKKTGVPGERLHHVDVEFTSSMMDELDTIALELNITRDSLIKTLVRQALDQHYLATSARRKGIPASAPLV